MTPALSKTTRALEEGCSRGLHPGVQIHVTLKGTTVASIALGERRPGETLRDNVLLLWLSSGKPITALAIAQQWERGRVDLDAPVAERIPEFAAGGKESITLRHLLTHTAGFRSADALPVSRAWDELTQAICRTPLDPGWVPGRTAGYQTHSSWHILAEVVHRLDGRDYPRYVRDEIFLPLGMRDSWIGMPSETYAAYGDRIGVTFNTFTGQPIPHPAWDSEAGCTVCRPGGNARGPARDLARFYEALLNGGRGIVRPGTIREFTRRQRSGLFDKTFGHVVEMGLGFILRSPDDRDTVPYGYGRHASLQTFGHGGSQSSCAYADPAHGLAVAWVCNGLPGEPRHQARQRAINAAIYEDLGLAPPSLS